MMIFNWKITLQTKINSLLSFAIFIGALVIGLWFYKFHAATLSNDQEVWERFGTFVGGTLGPTYAIISVWGVLWTILEMRKQSELSDLKNLLNEQGRSIDSTLANKKISSRKPGNPIIFTLEEWLIISAKDAKIGITFNEDEYYQAGKKEAQELQLEMTNFYLIWKEYKSKSEDSDDVYLLHFKNKYLPICTYLYGILLNENSSQRKFFDAFDADTEWLKLSAENIPSLY